MISLEKLKILKPLQKLPKNVVDLGKLIVAKCFEKLPNLVTLVPGKDLAHRGSIMQNLYKDKLCQC